MGSSPDETENSAGKAFPYAVVHQHNNINHTTDTPAQYPTCHAGILSLFFSLTITTMDMRYAGEACGRMVAAQ